MTEAHFPHSLLLFSSSGTALVASGPHIQLINTRTGDILSSTLNASDELKNSLLKSGPIKTIAVDQTWTHLLTLSDDKKLKIWKVEGLEFLHERELPKRPTSASFTADGQTIVVADKFGDVFSYPLHPATPGEKPVEVQADAAPVETAETPAVETETSPTEPEKASTSTKRKRKPKKPKQHENPPHPRDSVESHINPSGGTLVLGHTSLLTSFLFSRDEKYIITTDRDEHIRVSWFPQGYVIEAFCLGCSQFVSSLHIPKTRPEILISGGGDPEIKVWDWFSGKLKHDIPVLDTVQKYIQVKAQPYVRKNSRHQKRTVAGDDPMTGTPETESVEPEGAAGPSASGTPATEEPQEETIFVVNKLETVEKDGKLVIIFSVVGANALFATPFPEQGTDVVHVLEFGHPVLDFTLDEDGLAWVTVDTNLINGSVSWEGRTVAGPLQSASTQPQVKLVEIKSDGSLAEASNILESRTALLNTLNSTGLIPATSDDLSGLNLYSSLTSLPKKSGSGEDEDGEEDEQSKKQNQSKRDLGPAKGRKGEGKMKSKLAVLERQKQLQSPSVPEGESEGDRDAKRPRSELDVTEDITMGDVKG